MVLSLRSNLSIQPDLEQTCPQWPKRPFPSLVFRRHKFMSSATLLLEVFSMPQGTATRNDKSCARLGGSVPSTALTSQHSTCSLLLTCPPVIWNCLPLPTCPRCDQEGFMSCLACIEQIHLAGPGHGRLKSRLQNHDEYVYRLNAAGGGQKRKQRQLGTEIFFL